jgi:adenylylsulfate reductase subunit B
MPPVIEKEICNECQICYTICPEDVFCVENGEVVIGYPDECWHCGACMIDCPVSAIDLYIPLPMRLYVRRKEEIKT